MNITISSCCHNIGCFLWYVYQHLFRIHLVRQAQILDRSYRVRSVPYEAPETSSLAVLVLDRRFETVLVGAQEVLTTSFTLLGSTTVFFAILAFFFLPRAPSTWSLLDDRQKALARYRILSDSSVTVDEKLDIRDAFRPFKDPLYWVWAVISLSLGVPLASVNNFLPQIVASLGYSTIRTNLLTVAPNIVGTVALLLLTFSSDYFRERSIHICIPLITALVGFIILGTIDVLAHRQVAYFACFLLTMGVRRFF